uniref:Uncharacterized protein n=1 Tax=Aegilops tauschii subsp. strangulata TaxID=200361 RepID=A0A453HG00_AEGTS
RLLSIYRNRNRQKKNDISVVEDMFLQFSVNHTYGL